MLDAPFPPMKAVTGPLPTGPGWVYEIKWDGMRALVHNRAAGLRAYSSRLNDITARFPELQDLRTAVGELEMVLDGELVSLGEDGLPSFSRLQGRMHLDRPHDIERRRHEIPVTYVIFDLLHLDGRDTLTLPYDDRRRLLEALIEPGPSWQLASVHRDDAEALLEAIAERGMEGLIAKRASSPYAPGRRSSDWVKVKTRRRQELVVGGWLSGEAGRARRVAALLLGYYDDDGQLRFAGRVGSGLSELEATRLLDLLRDRPDNESAFVDPVPGVRGRTLHFVEPELVVEVTFAEWTPEGSLRHPVYLGQRADVDAARVGREPDPAPPAEA